MAFQPVNKSIKKFVTTRKWKEFSRGEFLEGTKEECQEKDKYKKPIFAIKVSNSNFGHPVGEMIYLNCGGNFLNDMNQVEEGEKVRITYNGQAKIKSGEWQGQLTHAITVEVDSPETSSDEDLI